MHLPREELGAHGEDLAFLSTVVGSMDVNGARRADAVAYKGGPVDDGGGSAYLDQLRNRVRMEEAQVRRFYLPGLVLRGPRQLGKIHRQKGSVYEAVYQMIH